MTSWILSLTPDRFVWVKMQLFDWLNVLSRSVCCKFRADSMQFFLKPLIKNSWITDFECRNITLVISVGLVTWGLLGGRNSRSTFNQWIRQKPNSNTKSSRPSPYHCSLTLKQLKPKCQCWLVPISNDTSLIDLLLSQTRTTGEKQIQVYYRTWLAHVVRQFTCRKRVVETRRRWSALTTCCMMQVDHTRTQSTSLKPTEKVKLFHFLLKRSENIERKKKKLTPIAKL